MPRALVLLILLCLPALCLAEEGKEEKKRKPPPPPAPGIWWAQSFDGGLARAAREGRPMLFCINALDTEAANLRLRNEAYKGADWGEASRGYVAFPCHPGTEDGPDGNSTRYVGTPAKTANDAINYVLKRFGQDLISPQHIILEPDGDLAFRKEYYTGVVGPRLLRTYLSVTSPPIAFTRASIDRESEIASLAATPTEALEAKVREWMKRADGYAGPVGLNLIEDELDATRRLALIAAFADLPKLQGPVAVFGAEERVSWPDDEPAETEAWVRALFGIDRELGMWAAARVMARSEDGTLRKAVLALWEPYGRAEQLRAAEASLLAGDGKKSKYVADDDEDMARRLARAEQMAGLRERRWPSLPDAFADARPAVVRGSLMEAEAEEVLGHQPFVEEALVRPRVARVRIAAALALLRAGKARDAARVSAEIVNAVFSPVEAKAARAHAIESLGDDPGATASSWSAAIQARLAGGAR